MKITKLKIAVLCILFAGGFMLIAPTIPWIQLSAIVIMLIGGAFLLWSVIEKYQTERDFPGLPLMLQSRVSSFQVGFEHLVPMISI